MSRPVIPRLVGLGIRTFVTLEGFVCGPGSGQPSLDGRPRCFFVIHNKNHVTIFRDIERKLTALGVSVFFVSIGGHRHAQQAISAARVAGLEPIDVAQMGRAACAGDVICVGNDWGPKRLLHWLARVQKRGVPLIGIVEGARFSLPGLYKRVDILLCWGPSGLEIGARSAEIVGSPVIEHARQRLQKKHDRPRVLINYKFSGTEEDKGFAWGAAAIEAARIIDPDFVISAHPSSRGVPADVQVSAEPFLQLLGNSTIVITKASTVIYEALAAGVSVLYFPHGDEKNAEFGDPLGAFAVANGRQELIQRAKDYARQPMFMEREARAFLDRHVSVEPDRPANDRIVAALIAVMKRPEPVAYL